MLLCFVDACGSGTTRQIDGELIFVASYDCRLRALRRSDGAEVWCHTAAEELKGAPTVLHRDHQKTTACTATNAMAAAGGGRGDQGPQATSNPWVGCVFWGAHDAKIRCADAAGAGALVFEVPVDGAVYASPVTACSCHGLVLLAATTCGSLYAWVLGSVKRADPSLLFRHAVGAPIFSTPAVDEALQLAVFGAVNGMTRAVSLVDGAAVWATLSPRPVFGSPALWCGTLSAGGQGSASDGLCVVGAHDGVLSCRATATGKRRWAAALGGPIVAAPFIFLARSGEHGAAFVAVTSRTGRLYILCLDSGETVACWTFEAEVFSSPVVLQTSLLAAAKNVPCASTAKESDHGGEEDERSEGRSAPSPRNSPQTQGNSCRKEPRNAAPCSFVVYVGARDDNLHALDFRLGV